MLREDVLSNAKTCVCGHRQEDYGNPEDNFKVIAQFWSVYKGVDFSAEDVAMMMALLKVARIKSGTGTTDSFVDLAGYAACAGEIATEAKGPEKDKPKEGLKLNLFKADAATEEKPQDVKKKQPAGKKPGTTKKVDFENMTDEDLDW